MDKEHIKGAADKAKGAVKLIFDSWRMRVRRKPLI